MSGIGKKKGGDETGKLYQYLMTLKTWENRKYHMDYGVKKGSVILIELFVPISFVLLTHCTVPSFAS